MGNEDWQSVYDYFLSPTLTGGRYSTQQSSLDNGNIYILSCEFISCSSSSNGGAIFVSPSSSTKMLIEESVFESCKTTGDSAAIYFRSGGNCVISRICGFNCSSKDYAFYYITCTDNVNTKNDLVDSSICSCHDSREFIRNDKGTVIFSRINISFNACSFNVGCVCRPSSSSSVTGTISYSSFANNTAAESRILLLGYYAKITVSSCNIMKNEQKSKDSCGIVYSDGPITVKDSCVLDNIAKYDFYSSSYSYPIEVTNCTLEPNVNSRKNSFVTITNTVKNAFKIVLFHFTTGNCKALNNENNLTNNNMYFKKKRKENISRMIILMLVIQFST